MSTAVNLSNARPLSVLTSRGFLVVIGAMGLIAGVMAAQSSLVSTPLAPAASVATVATTEGVQPAPRADAPTPGTSAGARAVMMVTVLAGLGIAFVLMRKRQLAGKNGQAPTLSLVGQIRIGGRWQVALVKVPGKTLVLGATDKGLSLLSTLDETDLEAQAELARLDHEAKVKPAPEEGLPDLPGLAAARERRRTEDDLPDLGALVGDDDRVAVRAANPLTQRPLTRPTEPFARLLEELNQLPARTNTATGPIPTPTVPGAHRDRMKTPEAQALRARLERYQSPTH